LSNGSIPAEAPAVNHEDADYGPGRATAGDLREVGRAICDWFRRNARELPWRRAAPDPYAVWVSEIMLQQTQVRTVEPYFRRWMQLYPTIGALAGARVEDVLLAWEGLGYYHRARRLVEAARIMVADHGAGLPETAAGLRALPGVGSYTAAAIGAIVFGRPGAALDANARRVLRRLRGADIGDRLLSADAIAMTPDGRASDTAQGLIELGSQVCLPASPRCDACPVAEHCVARRLGSSNRVGRSGRVSPSLKVTRSAALVTHDRNLLITRRGSNVVWAGLWELPWRDVEPGETTEACAQRAAAEVADVACTAVTRSATVRHAVTRYRVTLCAVLCDVAEASCRPMDCAATAWVAPSDLAGLPMPSAMRRLVHLSLEEALALGRLA
jgi:A/G-specific adenine glycosylase